METDKLVRILMVDDRAENLFALQVILSNKDYICVKANSGEEAMEILRHEQDFAIILMDVQMPVMNGYETVELIRKIEKLKLVPIIFLTASMDTTLNIFKGYEAGAVDYMIKPLMPEILKAKVAVFGYLYKKNQELLNQKEQLKKLNSDITAQKLISKYSLSLIEASHDPLFAINTEGKITDMNDASVKVTGLSRDQLLATDFFDYFTAPEKARELQHAVFSQGAIANSPLTFHHKDGTLVDVLFNGAIYKDDGGKTMGAVIVARDITDQKRFENELIEAKSKAERATLKAEESNRLKEAFLANMSHEIRTPMNAIIGFSDILSKRELGKEDKEFIVTIKTAGESLLTIINDILDISKIEAGMMTFEEHPFSIKEMFKSLNEMMVGKATAKNLTLSFDCAENIPSILSGDNTRLAQIIINLIDNAIKFTSKGKVQTKAQVLKSKSDITFLEFSIADTGIGIPQDKLEHIFERFRQAENHTTRKYGGTGLGLSIAKQLVELQGGTMSVESEFKKGSVFTFCIPFKNSNDEKPVTAIAEKKYNVEELSKLNILVVEDNQLNVKLILSLFATYNLKLQVAENGNVCIEKLRENSNASPPSPPFDIILMDMEMPVMNGYETTNIIRKDLKSNIPIIAMTANAMAGEKEKCLSLGMNDYISKPINANLLFEKMYEQTFHFLEKK